MDTGVDTVRVHSRVHSPYTSCAWWRTRTVYVYTASMRSCTRVHRRSCTRSRTLVHSPVTARLCTRVRSVYRAVCGRYGRLRPVYVCRAVHRPCTRPVHGRVHVYTALYGPCTRPVCGRVHLSTHVRSVCTASTQPCTRFCTCIRSVCKAVYGPCTRALGHVRAVRCVHGRVRGRVHRRAHRRVHDGRVHGLYIWPCTRRVHVYTAV